METVAAHGHGFSDQEWPFADSPNAATITTVRVIEDAFPILLVSHDDDGDWQVLCGTTNESGDGRILCLGCAFDRDRSIGQLADLPLGWRAWRKAPGSAWQRERNDSDGDAS